MGITREQSFLKYVEGKYKGKVHKMERTYSPAFTGLRVFVEFRIPTDEADEMEMYRRINRVLEVIAEGEE
jgi:hypothetical protein